jgi:hypothetical protein
MTQGDSDHEPPRCRSCGYDLTGMRVEDCCPECGIGIWPTHKELVRWAKESTSVLTDAFWLAVGAVPFWLLVPPFGLLISIAAIRYARMACQPEMVAQRSRRGRAHLLLVATGLELTVGVLWSGVWASIIGII